MKPKVILLFVLVIACALNCVAQDTTKTNVNISHAYWGEFGIGASSIGGFSAILYGNAQIGKNLLLTGGLQAESDQSYSLLNFSAHHEVDLNSVSLLIGKISKQVNSMFTISAGLSYVQHQDKTLYALFSAKPDVIQTKYTVGVPVLIRGYWVVGQCASLGAGVYGNFNTVQCTGGASLFFAFGQLQTHRPKHIKDHDPLHLFH